jgi:hypothetical protein
MMDTKECRTGALLHVPPCEVRLILTGNLPRARQARDLKECHIGILVVGNEGCTTEALLLCSTDIALLGRALKVEEDDCRHHLFPYLG